MGAVADATLAAGGEAHGVIPEALLEREAGHQGLTTLEVVDSMHRRKARMAELADGFVALPGGIELALAFLELLLRRLLVEMLLGPDGRDRERHSHRQQQGGPAARPGEASPSLAASGSMHALGHGSQ
jgi:hypothetical protein